jgi:hypothetical protein
MTKAIALLVLACAAARAQSTSTLGRAERRVSYEIAVGGNSSLIGSGYGEQTGTLRALRVSQRRDITGPMDVSIDGWIIQRRPSTGSGFLNYRFSPGRYQTLETSWLVAGVASASFPLRLPLDVVVDPAVGLGIAPIAYGRWRDQPTPGEPTSNGTSSTTSRAIVLTAGLSLRWRHIFVEQHFVQVTGADAALGNGENAPLMIGWRF